MDAMNFPKHETILKYVLFVEWDEFYDLNFTTKSLLLIFDMSQCIVVVVVVAVTTAATTLQIYDQMDLKHTTMHAF